MSNTISKLGIGRLWLNDTEVTATAAELNALDGITSTVAELNILDGVTATAAEINKAADASANVLTPGTGLKGTNSLYYTSVKQEGDFIKTTIFIDLTDMKSSTTDLDIIGVHASNPAHIGQITAAVNGTLFYGQVTCLETPATGVTDIDFYSATEGTGYFDDGIVSGTYAEAVMLTKGGAWSGAPETPNAFTALPAADKYMYMVGGAAGTVGTYTAGQFMIELWGV